MKNELMVLNMTEKGMTIKSTDLVEIINKFREVEGGKAELRHDSFMTKIKKELETLKLLGLGGQQNFLESYYINKQNKKQPCFALNRDGMLQMLNSESTYCRYKTIEYINKLEQDNKQLENDKEELHQIALSSKEQKKRKYEADKVLYGWKSIRSLLENCTYKNIEDTVNNIIDFHVNVLKKNDRAYSYKDMRKTEYKQAIRDRVFNILEDIYNKTLDGTLRSVVGELRVNNRQNVIETKNRSHSHKITELENKIEKVCPTRE
ncbi:hypothetical protein [Clostridium sp. KNHs214]|uniref:hypothetical protein n=1 Tax=Clostridium sp. KNHs214 TaxID=1540257 RepID=UPI00068E4FCF|nr:hypothetical protein [Clostridium sp. KNHs214]